MKFFITGGTGFVGSWVVDYLQKTYPEARITCLVRSPQKLRWLEGYAVHLHTGSLLDVDSLVEGVRDADYVLHIAGVTKALSVDAYYRGNVTATENLLQAVEQAAPNVTKIVHISSQAAVGPSPDATPIDETFPPHPITDYGKSKLESEQVARRRMDRLPITILRPPAVFGPRDMDVYEVFKNIWHGFNVKVGHLDQLVSIIHVWDLARGIVETALHPAGAGETYFICNDEPVWWSAVVQKIESVMGRRARTIPVPYPIAYAAAAVLEGIARLRKQPTILNRQKMLEVKQPYWVISNRKIREQLGFRQTVSLEEGIRNTIEWYTAHGYLR